MLTSPHAPSTPPEEEDLGARFAAAERHAQAVLKTAIPDGRAQTLLRAAQRAATVEQRVVWLRRSASAWAEPLDAVAACAPGCDHCCHIPVALSDVEARVIAKAIRRRVQVPTDAPTTDEVLAGAQLPGTPAPDAGYSAACPFLADKRCTIYEHRPMACRTQVNLDVDDFLCRLRPGQDVRVPYADASKLKGLYVIAQPKARWADLRAFFAPIDPAST